MKWLKLNDEEYIRLDSLKHVYLGADTEKVNGRVRLVYYWVFSDDFGEETADKLRFGSFMSKREAFEWFSRNVEPQLEICYENPPDEDELEDIEPFSVHEIGQSQAMVNPNSKKTSDLSMDGILSDGDVMDLEIHEHTERKKKKKRKKSE